MTATEASRAFSALLDAVEAGETVQIERAGRRVAVVSPLQTTNGRLVRDLLRSRVDRKFGVDLDLIRDALDDDGADAWRGA